MENSGAWETVLAGLVDITALAPYLGRVPGCALHFRRGGTPVFTLSLEHVRRGRIEGVVYPELVRKAFGLCVGQSRKTGIEAAPRACVASV